MNDDSMRDPAQDAGVQVVPAKKRTDDGAAKQSGSRHGDVTMASYFGTTENKHRYDGEIQSFGFAVKPFYGVATHPSHIAYQSPKDAKLETLSFSITSRGAAAAPQAYNVGLYDWDFEQAEWRPLFDKTFRYSSGTLNKTGELPGVSVSKGDYVMLGVKPVLKQGESSLPWYNFNAGLTIRS